MILDSLQHSELYSSLGDRLALALRFLRSPQAAALEPSALGTENSLRFEICGDEVFALVQRYQTRSPEHGFWEAHQKYIDVQCVMEGVESMGCAPLESMQVVQPYDSAKDFVKLAPRDSMLMNFVNVRAGWFAIFMPHDAHMPGVFAGAKPSEAKKIVVKVRV